MKLNIFSIRDARAGSIGHRQTITARANRISSVAINSSQSAGGENGRICEVAVDSFLRAIEDIASVT
jgi:hypothetical protein